MYKKLDFNPKISISLNSGIYVFDRESATGKTWLCNSLKELSSYGEPVDAYTYADFCKGLKLENILKPHKYEVVLLDRYDLYKDLSHKKLFEDCFNNTVVLVDCKSPFNVFRDSHWCEIIIGNNEIGVEE